MAKVKRRINVRYREARGAWEVDYTDARGRHRPLFPSEAEALAFAAQKREELEREADPDAADRSITLRAFAQQWLATVAQDLEARTLAGYRDVLARYVLPQLGAWRVADLRRKHIVKLWSALRGQHSANTARLAVAVLSSCLSDAVDQELLAANPALGVGRRRGRGAGSATPSAETIQPLSPGQRDRLLATAARPPFRPPYATLFAVLAKAGLRPSEAYTLIPEDVDLEGRTLRVERALDLGGRVKATKTHETRRVHLSRGLAGLLRQHLAWLKAEALRRGWVAPRWLFPSEAGTPLDHNNVAKVFKRALRAAGLPPTFRLYDLRHTFASLMLARGAPITYVSRQLGHRNPATTLRYYSRWIPGEESPWADLVDPGTAPPAPYAVARAVLAAIARDAAREGAPDAPSQAGS